MAYRPNGLFRISRSSPLRPTTNSALFQKTPLYHSIRQQREHDAVKYGPCSRLITNPNGSFHTTTVCRRYLMNIPPVVNIKQCLKSILMAIIRLSRKWTHIHLLKNHLLNSCNISHKSGFVSPSASGEYAVKPANVPSVPSIVWAVAKTFTQIVYPKYL